MKTQSDTAERLLSVAHALVLERGYNAFSYADLAEVVGIRKASIHHHFPTKADLVVTLLKIYRGNARDMIAAGMSSIASPSEQLRAFAAYWSGCIGTRSQSICLAALLSAELPSLPPEVQIEVRGHFADLSAWLASVLEHVPSVDADKAVRDAEMLMATIHGAMLSARAAGDPKLFERIADHALDRLLN